MLLPSVSLLFIYPMKMDLQTSVPAVLHTVLSQSMRPEAQAPLQGSLSSGEEQASRDAHHEGTVRAEELHHSGTEGSLTSPNTSPGYSAWCQEEKSPEQRTWRDRRLWEMLLKRKRCQRQKALASWFQGLTSGSAVS